jgi:hypothetical protein
MNQSGEIRPTIWLDGQIIGRWELDKVEKEIHVVLSLYTNVSKDIQDLVETERQKLEKFVNQRLLPISS